MVSVECEISFGDEVNFESRLDQLRGRDQVHSVLSERPELSSPELGRLPAKRGSSPLAGRDRGGSDDNPSNSGYLC